MPALARRLLQRANDALGPRSLVGQALVAFLLVNALLVLVMRFNGTGVLEPLSYVRFDSGHYSGIATDGYAFFPCNPQRYGPNRWCGNAAWFPGYPYLIRFVLRATGAPSPGAVGVLVSKAFLLGALVVLAFILRDFFGNDRPLPILLAAAVFPGAIYYQVMFPIAQLLFFTLLHMWLLLKRRYLLAGLCGTAAVVSYATAYTLAAVSGIYLLATYDSFKPFVKRALLVTGLTVLGVGIVFLIHHLAVGAWNAWFLVQAKYGFTPGRPLWALGHVLRVWGHPNAVGLVVAVQNVAVFALIMAATIDVIARRAWTDANKLFLIYALVFFFAPLTLVGPRLGYYRTYSVLLPAVVFLSRWPPAVTAGFVAVFAALFPLLSIYFFNSAIV